MASGSLYESFPFWQPRTPFPECEESSIDSVSVSAERMNMGAEY